MLHKLRGHLPRLVFTAAAQFNVPIAAVSCDVSQIPVLAVGRAEEYTLARMGGHPPAETRPILVIYSGNKSLYFVEVGFLHSGKLTNFENPVALQLFGGGLVVHIR